MVIRVFVASSSGSVAVSGASGGEQGEHGEQGEERGRRGQGSACGAGHCAGLAARPPRSAQPALGSEPCPRTPAPTRLRPWAALDAGLNLPRLRAPWGRKRQLSSARLLSLTSS